MLQHHKTTSGYTPVIQAQKSETTVGSGLCFYVSFFVFSDTLICFALMGHYTFSLFLCLFLVLKI